MVKRNSRDRRIAMLREAGVSLARAAAHTGRTARTGLNAWANEAGARSSDRIPLVVRRLVLGGVVLGVIVTLGLAGGSRVPPGDAARAPLDASVALAAIEGGTETVAPTPEPPAQAPQTADRLAAVTSAEFDPDMIPLADTPRGDCLAALTGEAARLQIRFRSGQAEPDPEQAARLRALAARAMACPGVALLIGGHSDASGPDDINMRLSWERAEAVARVLEGAGLPESRVEPVGYGTREPVAGPDGTPDTEASRRVEITILRAPASGTP